MILLVIGWFALAFLLGSATLSWFVIAFNHMGKWTIGGAENSFGTRAVSLCFGAFLGYLWYELFINSPFTITIERIAS